jgi:hypothetical protein
MFPSSENMIPDVYPEFRIWSFFFYPGSRGKKNTGSRILKIGNIQDGGPLTCEEEVDISRSAESQKPIS